MTQYTKRSDNWNTPKEMYEGIIRQGYKDYFRVCLWNLINIRIRDIRKGKL